MSDWTAEEELHGFFGPDSVTWRIHSDPTFSVGGLRALLLQALHPVAMDGVARFSGGFKEKPWPRLIRTATYVDTLTFGTRTEAQEAVVAFGASIAGWARPRRRPGARTGSTTRTCCWVHCCEVDSLLAAARRGGVPMTDDDADRYVAGQVTAAALIGISPRTPRLGGRPRRLLRAVRPELALTQSAREASRLILLPPMTTWVRYLTPAQPAWGVLARWRWPCCRRGRRMYSLPGLGLDRRGGDRRRAGIPAGHAPDAPAGPAVADRVGRLHAGGRRPAA